MTLEERKQALIRFLHTRVLIEDWQGLANVAIILKELEKEIALQPMQVTKCTTPEQQQNFS